MGGSTHRLVVIAAATLRADADPTSLPRTTLIMHRPLRTALAAAIASLVIATGPVAAFQPTVEVVDFTGTDWMGHTTDVAQRGARLVATWDLELGWPSVGIRWSDDAGLTWDAGDTITSGMTPHVESQAAVCNGRAIAAYAVLFDDASRLIRTYYKTFALPAIEGTRAWSNVGVIGRRPDVACIANSELAVAWFERLDDGGYKVVLETGAPSASAPSDERFSVGRGSPSRGLSVAATSDRVYVAWFQGKALKLRRYRIGTDSAHTLTSLGTTTIGTFPSGTTPKIGADGSRVVLAYTHGADLKVRRSTNRGVSFSAATTIRNLPDASEVGGLATTVEVKGSLVALGTIDVGGIDTLHGDGRGYKSTDGGASFTRLSTHAGGRVLATVVKPGSSYRWAELWDRSFDEDDPGLVRFRRQ